MDAIPAVSRQIKTMADGTLRLTIDIEPSNANDAFQLFGLPDVPLAIARIRQAATLAHMQAEIIKESEKVTGLALLAVKWCQEQDFWDFINSEYTPENHIDSESAAAEWVKCVCEVGSRKEINTNMSANQIFNDDIRQPYMLWKQESE